MLIIAAFSVSVRAEDPASYVGTPSRNQIQIWLRSGEPRLQAWAASFILKTKDTAFLPDLLPLVEQPLPPRPGATLPLKEDPYIRSSADQANYKLVWNESYLRNEVILDTFVQMNGDAPVQTLQRLAKDYPDQAIILLARKPPQEVESTLLALYNSQTNDDMMFVWRSAAALLALHPPAGFASSLLTSISVRVRLTVLLPGDPVVRTIPLFTTMLPSNFHLAPPPPHDWPSIFEYQLEEDARVSRTGVFPVIPGIYPILAERYERFGKGAAHSQGYDIFNFSDFARIAIVAEMLGVRESALGINAEENKVWHIVSNTQYRRAVAGLTDDYERRFAKVESLLEKKGLVDAKRNAQEPLLPKLALQLEDERSKKQFDLSLIHLCYSNVRWVDHNGADLILQPATCIPSRLQP
jgi:hypothetical protein